MERIPTQEMEIKQLRKKLSQFYIENIFRMLLHVDAKQYSILIY